VLERETEKDAQAHNGWFSVLTFMRRPCQACCAKRLETAPEPPSSRLRVLRTPVPIFEIDPNCGTVKCKELRWLQPTLACMPGVGYSPP
jgi:hypothetical protein